MSKLKYCLPVIALLLVGCRSKDEVVFSMDPVTNVEALWQIIDTKYCYIEEKGIDWQSIHDEYIARAALLKTDDPVALFDLCSSMLDSLQDGHVNLYSAFDRSYNTAWYDTYPANFDTRLQAIYLSDYRIAGGLYYCTIDNGNVGYVYYPSFSNSVGAANMEWVLSAFKDCKGLIVDVRNNGGGEITNAYRLANPFFSNSQTIGYWQHKTGAGHGDFSAMEPMKMDASMLSAKWQKPVIVLCNRHSYSAANLFVSLMRYADRSKIVGGISGGGGGMPMSYEMPCGWMVRFSSIRMFDREKRDIEQGIEPDINVALQSDDKDDIIEKAVELINNE